MPLPSPPRTLSPPKVATLPAGGRLHRVHLREFAGNAFNPCRGGPTRFAPIRDMTGKCVPSLYAGSTLEAAVFETVFHDAPATAPLKTVPLRAVEERVHSVLETRRDMLLAELRAPDLLRWSVSRRDLIESDASDYTRTAAWAAAIHRCFPDIDGLVWTSRQCDPDSVYLFFGDRAKASDFSALAPRQGAAFVADVRTAGRRAGIAITVP